MKCVWPFQLRGEVAWHRYLSISVQGEKVRHPCAIARHVPPHFRSELKNIAKHGVNNVRVAVSTDINVLK